MKSNFIYDNYLKAKKDLKKIKDYFWFSFFLFFFITIIGFLFPIFYEDKILEIIKSLIAKTQGLNLFELISFIMHNNIQSSFIGMILGIFLGVIPLGVLTINAYILGYVINKTVAIEGFQILWRLLPHGIFEIPAILISLALGLKLGISIMFNCIKDYSKKISTLNITLLILLSIIVFPIAFLIYMPLTLINKNLRKKFYENIKNSIRIFIFIVIPLLVIAGIIEGLLIWLS